MVNDVIVNLKFDANVLSTVVSIISILVSAGLVIAQIVNTVRVKKLESNLKNKGRIFEDRYVKTTQILESVWSSKSKLDILLNRLVYISKDPQYSKLRLDYIRMYSEFLNERNVSTIFSSSSKYWLGDSLYNEIIHETKLSEQILEELFKLKNFFESIPLGNIDNNSSVIVSAIEQTYGDKLNSLIKEHYAVIKNFEQMCIEKFPEN